MEINQFIDLIKKYEEQFPVDEWIIENVYIWPLLRFYLSNQRYGNVQALGSHYNSKILNVLRGIVNTILIRILDWKHTERIQNKKYEAVFLSRSTLRNFKLDGYYYAPITDTYKNLLELNGYKTLLLEFDPLRNFKMPRYSSSKIVQFHIELAKIKALIQKKIRKSIQIKLPEYENFLLTLKSTDIAINKFEKSDLIYSIFILRNLANYYKKILQKIEPEICFMVPYYIPECFAMCLACSELKIPTVDIQHGVQSNHIAYSYWKKFPEKGYNILPDFYWVWSKNEQSQIKQSSLFTKYAPNIIIGGNLWVDLWKIGENKLVSSYETKFDRKLFLNHYNILVSLQPLVDPSIILDAMQKSDSAYMWWIRLHPQMGNQYKKYHSLLQEKGISNYKIEEATEIALPYLLKHMHIHITGFSSVILEAEQFGVPSICFDKEAAVRYRDQIENKFLFEAYTDEQIKDNILQIIRKTKEKGTIQHKKPGNKEQPFSKLIKNICTFQRTD